MTTKVEILKRQGMENRFNCDLDPGFLCRRCQLLKDLDRYVLLIVEASLPEEKEYHKLEKCWICDDYQYACNCEAAWNACREKTLANAKKLLNIGGETRNDKE
jgi:hypothetical protein